MKQALFLLAALVAVAVNVSFQNQTILVPVAWIAILLLDRRVIRTVLRWKFLLLIAVLVFGVPLFCGEKNNLFYGLPYSREMFQMSVVMAQRSLILIMAIKMFTNRISVDHIAVSLQKAGLRRFGQVFALAMEFLPEIRSIAVATLQEHRQRNPKQNPISGSLSFLESLLVRVLRYAEQRVQVGDHQGRT